MLTAQKASQIDIRLDAFVIERTYCPVRILPNPRIKAKLRLAGGIMPSLCPKNPHRARQLAWSERSRHMGSMLQDIRAGLVTPDSFAELAKPTGIAHGNGSPNKM